MKIKAKKRLVENEKKYKAVGKRLCDLQHKEYMMFLNEVLAWVALFKETIKVKHIELLLRQKSCHDPTIEQLYCLLVNLYKSMRL